MTMSVPTYYKEMEVEWYYQSRYKRKHTPEFAKIIKKYVHPDHKPGKTPIYYEVLFSKGSKKSKIVSSLDTWFFVSFKRIGLLKFLLLASKEERRRLYNGSKDTV